MPTYKLVCSIFIAGVFGFLLAVMIGAAIVVGIPWLIWLGWGLPRLLWSWIKQRARPVKAKKVVVDLANPNVLKQLREIIKRVDEQAGQSEA